jgi:hypothetical protein
MNGSVNTATRTTEDPLNAICPYWTMFPLSFPLSALVDARGGDWVLDPFCGRGTTLYAARKLGLPAVGIDSNEVAATIAAAKLVSVAPASIVALARELIESEPDPILPEGEFWRWCFAPGVLDALCRLRGGLMSSKGDTAAALRAIVLGALHGPRNKGEPNYLSNQMPRTYATKPKGALAFWKARDMHPSEVDLLAVIRRHADRRYTSPPPRSAGAVHLGDALAVLSRLRRRFGWVITSPPYPGMVTYRPDGWLRGWLLGGPPAPDYGRAHQLGALTGSRFTSGLAGVWSAVADRCLPRARLVVRFGALPSARSGEPEDLLLASLELSGRWRVRSVRDAGLPRRVGARQAEQALKAGAYVPEIDVVAVRADNDA